MDSLFDYSEQAAIEARYTSSAGSMANAVRLAFILSTEKVFL